MLFVSYATGGSAALEDPFDAVVQQQEGPDDDGREFEYRNIVPRGGHSR